MDELLATIEFEMSPIPHGVVRQLDEVTIKREGCVWRIHKNDADPFPSNPHAHNVESGLKLDLSTGALYFRSRLSGKSIARRHLDFIRAEATANGITIPALAV
jgi:hypothetical protein